MPNAVKGFNQKLSLKINDNPNKKVLALMGQGEALRVEVGPSQHFQLGPVLPGDSECVVELLLQNPTDHPIEAI